MNDKGAAGAPVTPGGPGDKAGIEAGDVITEVDGVRVHSGQELIVKIRSHRPGDRLRLTLERDGDARTAELTLGAATSEGAAAPTPDVGSAVPRGAPADRYGVEWPTQG